MIAIEDARSLIDVEHDEISFKGIGLHSSDLPRDDIAEQQHAKKGCGDAADGRRYHVCDGRCHFDGQKTSKAHHEADSALREYYTRQTQTSSAQVIRETHGDDRPPDESAQRRKLARCGYDFFRAKEQLCNRRYFSGEYDQRNDHNRTKQVSVPRKVHGAALDNIKALLDNDRVYSGDCGTCNAESDTEQ